MSHTRFLRGALFVASALSLAPLAAAQTTIYADANLTTGANDGSSWADAFQGPGGVQFALLASTAGDQVWAAQGTYLPTNTGNRSASFAMVEGVEIYGGFLGGEATVADRPPIGTAPSVLSGDLNGDDGGGSFGDNSIHVVTTAGTSLAAILDGFTVAGGNANAGGSNNDRGGGILCTGAVSPRIRNCRFVGNRCTFGGAAGYINNGGAPRFSNTIFEDGDGGSFGGAFDIAGGGAVWFDRCIFRNNTASRAGALEIFASNGVRVRNCIFEGNVATGGTGGGGAIWIGSGGNPRFRNCTVVGNSSTNQAQGGLRNQGATGATVVNCIFWDNSGPGGAQASTNQVSAGTNVTYSVVEGGYTGTGNLAADPLLVDLGGGVIGTLSNSPAVDAGDNAALPSQFQTDYLGNPRYVDNPAVADTGSGSAPLIDIGAIEFQVQAIATVPGCFGNPATLATTGGALQVGQSFDLQLTTAAIPTGLAIFYVGVDGTDPGGCGVPLPGLGEVLLALAPFPTSLSTPAIAGGQATFSAPVPADPGLAGVVLAFQGVGVDLVTPGTPVELSDMLVGAVAP